TRGSGSKSTTTKSAGNWNFPTFTKTSSAASCKSGSIQEEIDFSIQTFSLRLSSFLRDGDPSTDNDIGIVDSGCSRSMTGNKEKLDDNVADLLTKAFDGPRFAYLVVHIGMVVNTAAGCTFFLLTEVVSASCTMILLVVILSAGRLVSAGGVLFLLVAMDYAAGSMYMLVVILSVRRLVSVGCTMILLVVILSAGRLVSAGGALFLLVAMDYAAGSMYMLVGIFLLVDPFLLIGCVFLLSA
ncbi:hypothetical protein Tco_1579944, partial [Tanacetum coccineum]